MQWAVVTRDGSVARAEDCSSYLVTLRSPVQIRFAGASFFKLVQLFYLGQDKFLPV